MPLIYFAAAAAAAAILFLALGWTCGGYVTGRAQARRPAGLPVIALGWALSLVLAITYLVCVAFDLLFPGHAMYETWSGLLPGLVWLTPTGFAIGLIGRFLYGWSGALIVGGLYNALVARARPA